MLLQRDNHNCRGSKSANARAPPTTTTKNKNGGGGGSLNQANELRAQIEENGLNFEDSAMTWGSTTSSSFVNVARFPRCQLNLSGPVILVSL